MNQFDAEKEQSTETINSCYAVPDAGMAPVHNPVWTAKHLDEQPIVFHKKSAEINLSIPSIKGGSPTFRSNINRWINNFQERLLVEDNTGMSLEQAADAFLAEHAATVAENPGAITNQWTVTSDYHLLYETELYLTIQLTAEVYRGGAHGSYISATRTFETERGHMVDLENFVTDKEAFKTIVEQHFRQARPDIFAEGFEFNDIFPFTLPTQFGLVENGIFINYVPYEVTPYAFGNTEFVVPFEAYQHLEPIGC